MLVQLALPDIKSFDALPRALLRKAKLYGFSDSHIAKVLSAKFDCTEDDVRAQRKVRKKVTEERMEMLDVNLMQSQGIVPSVKQVDTLAAEFPAQVSPAECSVLHAVWADTVVLGRQTTCTCPTLAPVTTLNSPRCAPVTVCVTAMDGCA